MSLLLRDGSLPLGYPTIMEFDPEAKCGTSMVEAGISINDIYEYLASEPEAHIKFSVEAKSDGSYQITDPQPSRNVSVTYAGNATADFDYASTLKAKDPYGKSYRCNSLQCASGCGHRVIGDFSAQDSSLDAVPITLTTSYAGPSGYSHTDTNSTFIRYEGSAEADIFFARNAQGNLLVSMVIASSFLLYVANTNYGGVNVYWYTGDETKYGWYANDYLPVKALPNAVEARGSVHLGQLGVDVNYIAVNYKKNVVCPGVAPGQTCTATGQEFEMTLKDFSIAGL